MNNTTLKTVLNEGVVYIDARYLYDNRLKQFISILLNTLSKHNKKIKIGLIVDKYNEDFKNIKFSNDDIDLSSFFYICYKLDFKNPHIDHLKNIFKKNNTLFLTQDQSIAFKVSNLSKENNVIYVRRASSNSLLESFPMIVGDVFNDRPLFSYILGTSPRIDKISQDCEIPKENSVVYINDTEVTLKNQIGLGGEGRVYTINDELVAKIYSKEKLTKTRSEKISIMVKKRINDYSICWPISEIKNKENFVVGYTMKRCIGKPISTLYRGNIITQQLYPGFTKLDSIEIVLGILDKMNKLHNNNVLLGDINDRNFLVDFDNKDIFLIDTDSYQLEDYSCDVGTIGYIAPELKGGVLSTSLRTFEDEGYGVAVFIFRTLMQGYFPFAKVGEDADYVKLIKKQDFPYTLKDKETKNNVPPLAFDLWSGFPLMLKKMFIRTFDFQEQAKAQNRYSVEQWIIALEQFRNFLLDEIEYNMYETR